MAEGETMKSIWDEAYATAERCEGLGVDEAKLVIRDALLKAYTAALTEYAWWKDGEQFVGSCGTTLAMARDNARKDASVS